MPRPTSRCRSMPICSASGMTKQQRQSTRWPVSENCSGPVAVGWQCSQLFANLKPLGAQSEDVKDLKFCPSFRSFSYPNGNDTVEPVILLRAGLEHRRRTEIEVGGRNGLASADT